MRSSLPDGLFADDHGTARCLWCQATPGYRDYHDGEWGFPVADDRRLFEKICLEGFQSGLSWITILKKREAFRQGFAHFDIDALAGFGQAVDGLVGLLGFRDGLRGDGGRLRHLLADLGDRGARDARL